MLKGGQVVTPEGIRVLNVEIKDDRLVRFASPFEVREGLKTIDVSGKIVLPGLIDAHVHFRTPGEEYKEDWETGSRAALAGGVTTVLDMPNNTPPITSKALLEAKRSLLTPKANLRFGLYMGAMWDSTLGRTNVEEFLASDAVALKVYMGSSTGSLLVHQPEALEELFRRVGETDRVVAVHAEDHHLLEAQMARYAGSEEVSMHSVIRSEEVAFAAVRRAFEWAERYGTRLHLCHMSTLAELELFRGYRSERISAEVTPHHLFLDVSAYEQQGNFVRVNPPLRRREDREALLDALATGEIPLVATDHAPHTRAEKERPYSQAPSGLPGVETLLPLVANAVHEGRLTWERVAEVTSATPARVFGLSDRGRIVEGALADLTVVDPALVRTVEAGGFGNRYTKCGWTPFAGRALTGWPVMTVVGGEIRMHNDDILV